jgi:PmbA protein
LDINALETAMKDAATGAVELARSLGASQSEAGASADEGLSVTVRMGEIESVERHASRGIGITVYCDGRKGTASTSELSESSIDATVRKALSIASHTEADAHAGLADAELMGSADAPLDLYHPWDLDVDAAGEIALEAEDAARGADDRIENSEGANVSTDVGYRAYANSHGFSGGHATSSHSISCSVIAAEDDELERDYWVSSARASTDLESARSVGLRSAERAVARLGAQQIKTCQVPVVYPAELARGLLGHLISAISGSSLYRRASFLLDSIGRQIFPDFVTIEEEPHLPRAFGSAQFDSDGVQTHARTLIDAGKLTGYVLSAYSARRLKMQTTGNAGGIHNLVVGSTGGDLSEIISSMDKGFVVGELLGQGVNTVTGDYSRGAAGFWVERGEIVHAVNEVTIAGNLADIYSAIELIGSDTDTRGVIRTGSVLVGEMTVAGA